MTNAVQTTVTEALEALAAARQALEAAELAELEATALVDEERAKLATNAPDAARSELTKAQRALAAAQEARFQAEAGLRRRDGELEAARAAALAATRAEFYAVRDQLAAAYEARRAGVRSLLEDIAKLLATAKGSLDELADHEEAVRSAFGARGVTAPLGRVRRLDKDPHLWRRLNDAIQALYGEYR